VRSYEGSEHLAKPRAATRSRPRCQARLLDDLVRPQ
jgi:hypothetical protein